MLFKPRKVPSTNMKSWFVEALELSKRHAVLYVALGVLTMGLAVMDKNGLVLTSLFPLILSLGCVVAKSADHSESILKSIVEVAPRAWARVLILGSAPAVFLVIVTLIVTLLVETINPSSLGALFYHMEQSQELSATRNTMGFSIIVAIVVLVIGFTLWITSYLWFFWTLIVIGELPVFDAVNESFEGFFINKFVAWPYALCVLTLSLVFLMPVIIIPWLAVSTSMMYVSFRDVWLGRKDNHPAVASAAEPVLLR